MDHYKIVVLLIEFGLETIEINARDEIGRTPLMIACSNGFVNIVEVLLSISRTDKHAVDHHKQSALFHAATMANTAGHFYCVHALLMAGTDVEEKLTKFSGEPRDARKICVIRTVFGRFLREIDMKVLG